MSARLVHPLLLRRPGSPSCRPCSVHAEGAHGCDDPHGSVHGQLKHRVSSWNMYQLSEKYEHDAPCEWIAHDTQYAILMYNFGITYSNNIKTSIPIKVKTEIEGRHSPWYTDASEISLTAALSTMFLTVKRLIALSFATQREQLEQRTKLTWPRPFLLRPPLRLFLV